MPYKAKRRSKLSRRVLLPLIFILLLLFGLACFAIYRHYSSTSLTKHSGSNRSTNSVDYSPATKADNAANENRKGSSSPPSTLDSSTPPPNNGDFAVTINRAGLDSSKQNLQVATLINGVSSGTCTAYVSQTDQTTITQTVDISLQVNHYVCPVINIPVSRFPNKGKWYVSVTVSSDGKTVTASWASNPVSLSD